MFMFVWAITEDLCLLASQACLFAGSLVTLLTVDALPLFLFFCSQLGFTIKPSCVSALDWQMGSLCQVDVELAKVATLPFIFFHHALTVPLLFGRGHRAWPCSNCSAASYAALRSGSSTTLLPALSGNLPVWVAKCAHYARYYHIAALGEVAKCSGVWYAVKLPMYPRMGVHICLFPHLDEIRSKIEISCGFEFPTFLHCHCHCGERSRSKNTRIYHVCAWKHVFMQDEVKVSSVFLPLSGLVCTSDGRGGKVEEKNKKAHSFFLWSPSVCACGVWSMWRDSLPAACMKPQLGEIRRRSPWRKPIQPRRCNGWQKEAPISSFSTHVLRLTVYLPGESRTFATRRAAWTSWKMKHLLVNLPDSLSHLTSALPVALKKKQPYTSPRAPFGGHY